MANFFRAKREGCVAAGYVPPPWIVEMFMCGRTSGPFQNVFDEARDVSGGSNHDVMGLLAQGPIDADTISNNIDSTSTEQSHTSPRPATTPA